MSSTVDDFYQHKSPQALTSARAISVGFAAILVVILALCAWIVMAPVASAVITQGVVVVDTKTRVVQHPDGGVLRSILVRDGSTVIAGQILGELETTRQDNLIKTLEPELALVIAIKSRLYSEISDEPDVAFPLEADGLKLSNFPMILSSQQRHFRARRSSSWLRKQELQTNCEQDSAVMAGLRKQLMEIRFRIGLVGQDESAAFELAKEGFGTRRSLREVQAMSASLLAEEAGIISHLDELKTHLVYTNYEIKRVDANIQEEDELELQKVSRDEQELLQHLNEARLSVQRSTLKSPVDGVVMNLSVATVGGVLGAASPFLEVVPSEEPLVVEAQVEPVDADGIVAGSPIRVRAEGIGSQRMPMVAGTLISISPDRVIDKTRGSSYFIARASVDRDKLLAARGVDLKPGVPVEVVISKKPRSVLSTLIGPILNLFTHALRE